MVLGSIESSLCFFILYLIQQLSDTERKRVASTPIMIIYVIRKLMQLVPWCFHEGSVKQQARHLSSKVSLI